MQSLLAVCRGQPPLCDRKGVPTDEVVLTGSDAMFTVRWYWLRETLDQARISKPDAAGQRLELLARASDRLEDESSVPVRLPQLTVDQERKQADKILSLSEFRRVQHAGYLQQKLAALSLFLDRLFSGATNLIPQSPWFATLLEWMLLGLAGAALMLWVWRVSTQQRLVINAPREYVGSTWQKDSEDWADRARAEAQRGQWRDAVHSLYWSAIVLLEGQKLWRQSRTRTPREYVQLLEPGSDRRAALNALTRSFEHIWYGLRAATEDDYRQAAEVLERLRLA